MWNRQWTVAAVAFIMQMIASTTAAEDEARNITIMCPDYHQELSCPEVKIIEEYRLELVCEIDEAFTVHWFKWIHENGTDINELASPRMTYTWTNHSATLIVDTILMGDFGNFTCETSNPDLTTQTFVNVYVVPDYFVAGVVLLSVNLALFLLFIACMVRSIIKQKADKKNLYKPDKSELEKLSNKS